MGVEQARQKKIAGEKLLAEVHAVNSAAMKIKEDKMLAEKLEEQKIIEYRDKAQRDKQEAMNRELADARLLQQAEKERRLGQQAKFERDEFDRIINVQMEQEGAERQRQA